MNSQEGSKTADLKYLLLIEVVCACVLYALKFYDFI